MRIVIALVLMLLSVSALAQQRAACLAPTASVCQPTTRYFWNGVEYPDGPTAAAAIRDTSYPGLNVLTCTEAGEPYWKAVGPDSPQVCSSFGFILDVTIQTTPCPSAATLATSGPPVDEADGNHHQREMLYVGGISLTLYHNSADPTLGVFGAGWRHHWDDTIAPLADGRIRVTRHTGETIDFTNDNGAWKPDERFRLVMLSGWVFLHNIKENVWETYDQSGKLLWRSALGDGTSVVYNMLSYGNGQIAVSDQYGRVLTMHLNGAGRVIKAVTPSGEDIWFDYDAVDNLVSASFPRTGLTRRYLYGEPDRILGGIMAYALTGSVDSTHALTGIMNNETRVATITYDVERRSMPQNPAMGSIWQAPEQVAGAFLRFLPRVRPVTPPPASGTMGINQPPPGHALPIPANRPDLRPTERPDRPGPLLSEPLIENPISQVRSARCKAAAEACLLWSGADFTVDEFFDPENDGSGEGACPIPDWEISQDSLTCLSQYIHKCLKTRERVEFPDGSVVDAQQ